MSCGNVAEDEGWLKVMEAATLTCLPLAARAALLLNIPHILATHAAAQSPPYLSAAQIVSHFDPPINAASTTVEQASASLDRILRVIACHGLLSTSSSHIPISPHQFGASPPITTYALNSFSHYLLQTEAHTSLAPFLLLIHDPISVKTFSHLHEAILDGTSPIKKAHGMDAWSFFKTQPRLNHLFNQAMVNNSTPSICTMLELYHGFDDITSLVDVGGGLGACLHMITSKYPHIKGINFDLPHVIADAPPYPGVQHVGGDMLEGIPQASAIFMKAILHSWSDAHCSKILKNCYRALPQKGKVIMMGSILPTQVYCKPSSHVMYQMDLIMFTFQGGKERTYDELEKICKASGFLGLEVKCNINADSVVEIYK